MITQKHKQCDNEIVIETAESIEDAKKNNFKEGEFNRYYVNGKLIENYLAMVRFIIEETKKNKKAFIPETNLNESRNQMLQNQNNAMRDQMNKLKEQYKSLSVPESVLQSIEHAISKIDERGMRNIK